MSRKAKVQPIEQQKMLNRAVIYLRVSTDEQATDGYGLDAQRMQCTAYAQAFSLQIVETLIDDGISGTKDANGRPALASAIELAKSGKFDILITASLDRIARNALLLLGLWDSFEALGISIVCVKERIDTSTAVGRLMRTVIAAIAEFERDTIVARTTAGRNERGKIDGEKGGRVPMGYQRVPGDGVIVDEDAAKIVRNVFALRRMEYTMQAIADYLNMANVPTPRGHRWHGSSVKAVLDNEAIYRGARRGDSDVHWHSILIT